MSEKTLPSRYGPVAHRGAVSRQIWELKQGEVWLEEGKSVAWGDGLLNSVMRRSRERDDVITKLILYTHAFLHVCLAILLTHLLHDYDFMSSFICRTRFSQVYSFLLKLQDKVWPKVTLSWWWELVPGGENWSFQGLSEANLCVLEPFPSKTQKIWPGISKLGEWFPPNLIVSPSLFTLPQTPTQHKR